MWQLDVYRAQGAAVAARRAAEPPVALTSVAPAGAAVRDGYGRSVQFRVLPRQHQLLLPVDGRPNVYRVLTPLRQPDGSIVPVIRGLSTVNAGDPPTGPVDHVHPPAVGTVPGRPATELTAVQVPVLAQRWPGPWSMGLSYCLHLRRPRPRAGGRATAGRLWSSSQRGLRAPVVGFRRVRGGDGDPNGRDQGRRVGSADGPGHGPRLVRNALIRYRIMAYTVGVLLVVLMCVGCH